MECRESGLQQAGRLDELRYRRACGTGATEKDWREVSVSRTSCSHQLRCLPVNQCFRKASDPLWKRREPWVLFSFGVLVKSVKTSQSIPFSSVWSRLPASQLFVPQIWRLKKANCLQSCNLATMAQLPHCLTSLRKEVVCSWQLWLGCPQICPTFLS